MGCFGPFLRQCLVMKRARSFRVQTQIELIFPPEFETRFAQSIISDLRAWMTLRKIRGMRRDLIGDYPFLYVIPVRQPEMFFWCDVTEHRRPVPSDHRGSDRAREVIVPRSNISC